MLLQREDEGVPPRPGAPRLHRQSGEQVHSGGGRRGEDLGGGGSGLGGWLGWELGPGEEEAAEAVVGIWVLLSCMEWVPSACEADSSVVEDVG